MIGGPRVISCRTAHVALVTMKIGQHIKMRATTNSSDNAKPGVAATGLNAGHRAEWVEELSTVCETVLVQKDRACNGLRLTDDKDPHCADPTYRTPQSNANAPAVLPAASPAAAVEDTADMAADTAAALAAWRVVADNDEEEETNHGRDDNGSDGDSVDIDDAAVEAARAAIRRSLEEDSVAEWIVSLNWMGRHSFVDGSWLLVLLLPASF